jgi:hyaluronan synthase
MVIDFSAGPTVLATDNQIAPKPKHRRETGHHLVQAVLVIALATVVALVCLYKIVALATTRLDPVWATYSIVVTSFIFTRFVLAWLYRPPRREGTQSYCPTVAIIVPAYNEPAIAETLLACVNADYPRDRLRVVVVDDKSTDDTLQRINDVARCYPELVVIAAEVNRGKRHAMAAGISAAGDAEILVFIDSDSQVRADAIRVITRYFSDPKVGAVAGHTDVANKDTNILTRMQSMQYYIAFRIYKSAEALFGAVTCCSGCFSAYRSEAVAPVLDKWLHQSFLGRPSTFGDDRSLTNYLLPKWHVLYAPDAQAYTNVPERLRHFVRQQLRWKKSWLREAPRAMRAILRKNPVMVVMFGLSIILPLLAPQVVLRAFVVQPHFVSQLPYWYFGGVAAMALIYGLYYRLHNRDKHWYQGIPFTMFYTVVLVLQLPLAMATIRDSSWGTR